MNFYDGTSLDYFTLCFTSHVRSIAMEQKKTEQIFPVNDVKSFGNFKIIVSLSSNTTNTHYITHVTYRMIIKEYSIFSGLLKENKKVNPCCKLELKNNSWEFKFNTVISVECAPIQKNERYRCGTIERYRVWDGLSLIPHFSEHVLCYSLNGWRYACPKQLKKHLNFNEATHTKKIAEKSVG